MKRIIYFSLCAAATLAVTSCDSKVATEMNDANDSITYAFAVVQGSSMAEAKATGMYPELNDLDEDLFVKGIKEALDGDGSQDSYYMGLAQGMQLKSYFDRMSSDLDVEFNEAIFAQVFAQALAGDTTLQMAASVARGEYDRLMRAASERHEQAILDSIAATPEAKKNLEAGLTFLAAKEKEEGVVKTESGLLYKVIKEGKGEKIGAQDVVNVAYVGKLINDTIFDQNDNARFRVSQVIPGWTEGLQLMSVGAKYEFYIPSDLAYGVRGSGDKIPSNSTLVFEVEVLEKNK